MFVKPLAADLPGIQFKRPITVSVKKNLSIKEHLLTSATDMVECLRTDPSKVILLKFYLGNTEESSAIWLRIGDMAEDCYKKCAWT